MDSPGNAFIQRFDLAPTGKGPLDGLTFAVKDNIDVAGMVTGCGNPTWAATHPPAKEHALVVETLLNSGARALGKVILDEFAFSLVGENHFYGTPLNPRSPDRVPGGSSSGSASAVASGEVDFALGTDTGGSVRVPAANCGLYGLRPTWGRFSVAGVQALAPSFDTVGILTRELLVLERVVRALSPSENSSPIDTVFVLEEAWALAGEEVRAVLPAVIERMKRAGLKVETTRLASLGEGELGTDMMAWKNLYSSIQWPEIMSIFGGWLDQAKPGIGPKIDENFELAKNFSRTHLAKDVRCREETKARIQKFLKPGTALCIPTVPSPPPLLGKVDYDRVGAGYVVKALSLTAIAGIGSVPQIALPMSTADNLPIGVSLIGGANTDLALISAVQNI
jgi:amidase